MKLVLLLGYKCFLLFLLILSSLSKQFFKQSFGQHSGQLFVVLLCRNTF